MKVTFTPNEYGFSILDLVDTSEVPPRTGIRLTCEGLAPNKKYEMLLGQAYQPVPHEPDDPGGHGSGGLSEAQGGKAPKG